MPAIALPGAVIVRTHSGPGACERKNSLEPWSHESTTSVPDPASMSRRTERVSAGGSSVGGSPDS